MQVSLGMHYLSLIVVCHVYYRRKYPMWQVSCPVSAVAEPSSVYKACQNIYNSRRSLCGTGQAASFSILSQKVNSV